MPRFKQNRPGINSPNQKQGSIETFERGKGWTMKNGTSGQVPQVQSDGTVEFASLSLNYVGSYKYTQYLSGSGTHSFDANMLFSRIVMYGGGGGGGGAQASGAEEVTGGGGGEGEFAEGYFSAATLGASQSYSVGGGGGGANGSTGGNGSNGSTTSVGSILTAAGGTGGTGSGASSTSTARRAGGAGGTGGAGTGVHIAGQAGWHSDNNDSGNSHMGGRGGGKGGGRGGIDDETGVNGTAPGGGGGGGANDDSTGGGGGDGAAGAIYIWEYLKV